MTRADMLPITPVMYTSVSTTWAAKVTCLFDISTGWDIKRGAIRVELIIGKVSFQISVEVSDIFWRLSFLLYAIIDWYFTRVYLIQSMNLQTMSNILELFRSQAEISKARCWTMQRFFRDFIVYYESLSWPTVVDFEQSSIFSPFPYPFRFLSAKVGVEIEETTGSKLFPAKTSFRDDNFFQSDSSLIFGSCIDTRYHVSLVHYYRPLALQQALLLLFRPLPRVSREMWQRCTWTLL